MVVGGAPFAEDLEAGRAASPNTPLAVIRAVDNSLRAVAPVYGARMSPHSRATWSKFLVPAVAFTLLLSGCSSSPAPPASVPPATAIDAPVFATDAQAVVAATAAYAAYSDQMAAVYSTPGSDPEEIRTVASRAFADVLIAEVRQLRESGRHIAGETSFAGVSLQSVDETARAGVGAVVVELCLDVSGADITDATGASIVDQTLPAKTPYLVSFDWQDPADPRTLLVGSQEPLPGTAECG